jgi:hypothetical protein
MQAIDGVMYQADLNAAALSAADGSVQVPFSAFRATFRGTPVPRAPPLRGEDIVQLGFMLSRFDAAGGVQRDVAPGQFWLSLRSLEAQVAR